MNDQTRAVGRLEGHKVRAEARRILDTTADYFRMPVHVLDSRRRDRNAVQFRHTAIWLLRDRMDLSYPVIGALFDRDHSSVIYANKVQHAARLDAILNGWSHPTIRIEALLGPVE